MFDTALNELINIIEQNTDASININPDFFNGSCLQVEGHDEVYLLTNNKKYYVNNPAEFNSCNFDWNKISSYPQIVIDAIPEGKKTCLCLQINLNLNYLLKSEPVGFG